MTSPEKLQPSYFLYASGTGSLSPVSSLLRKVSSTRPPARSSIGPDASQRARLSDSVRYAQTRSIGPGSTRRMRSVRASGTTPNSPSACSASPMVSLRLRSPTVPFSLIVCSLFRGFAQLALEGVEPRGPERALPLDPGGRLVQGAGVERQKVFASGAAAAHQLGALEHADVLGHRVERDRERPGQIGHARLALGQAAQDGAPSRIGQRQQRLVEIAIIHPHG